MRRFSSCMALVGGRWFREARRRRYYPAEPGFPEPTDNNGGAGQVLGVPRLGIPSLQQADSAVGIRMAAPQSRYATLLPSVLAAASSWDPEAAHLYGDVIGRELRAQGYNQSIG